MISETDVLSDQELVEKTHDLAVIFYERLGYYHKPHHQKLYNSKHPTEIAVWEMACDAFLFIRGSEPQEVLDSIQEEVEGG